MDKEGCVYLLWGGFVIIFVLFSYSNARTLTRANITLLYQRYIRSCNYLVYLYQPDTIKDEVSVPVIHIFIQPYICALSKVQGMLVLRVV